MATTTIRPNANGDEINGAQYPDSGYFYDKVDDVTPDELDTYIYNNESEPQVSWMRSLFHLNNPTVRGIINKITVYARMRVIGSSGVTGYGRICIKTHGTVYETGNIELSQSFTNYSQVYSVNPYTGSQWTWSEIDNLQAGVNLHGYVDVPNVLERAVCTQIYVVIDYLPAYDIGLRYRHGGSTYKIEAQELQSTHKLRIYKDGVIYGIPLVDVSDPNASPIRIYDGSTIKALKKYSF